MTEYPDLKLTVPGAIAQQASTPFAMVLQLRRRNIRRLVRQLVGVAVVVVGCVAGLVAMSHRVLSEPTSVSRILAEASSSSDSYSCGKLASWETSGGIVLYIMALGYIFVSLAIICDDYFVSALENISQKVALPPDVAGATFMAADSSAPELFVSLADNVFKKPAESMGVGIVVGSALFNILIIISLSALLAGQVLKLDWRPLLRDSLWYTWAISVLTFAVWDGSVDVPDSVIMVCSYASYIGYMAVSERVVSYCCKRREVDQQREKERGKLTFASVSTSDAISTAEVIVTAGDVLTSIVTTEDVQKLMDEEGHSDSQHKCLGEQDNTMLRVQQHMFQAQQPLQHMVSIDQPVDVEAPCFSEKVIARDQLSDVPAAGVGEEVLLMYINDELDTASAPSTGTTMPERLSWRIIDAGIIEGHSTESEDGQTQTITLHQADDGIHWFCHGVLPELIAGSRSERQAICRDIRRWGLVFEAHPQLHQFPWSVSTKTSNRFITKALGKQAFRFHKKVLARQLSILVDRLDQSATTDEWQ